jgi:hypothetical protein
MCYFEWLTGPYFKNVPRITAVWAVLVNFCNLELEHFKILILMMKMRVTGNWGAFWSHNHLFLIKPVKMAS